MVALLTFILLWTIVCPFISFWICLADCIIRKQNKGKKWNHIPLDIILDDSVRPSLYALILLEPIGVIVQGGVTLIEIYSLSDKFKTTSKSLHDIFESK